MSKEKVKNKTNKKQKYKIKIKQNKDNKGYKFSRLRILKKEYIKKEKQEK